MGIWIDEWIDRRAFLPFHTFDYLYKYDFIAGYTFVGYLGCSGNNLKIDLRT